MIKLIYGEETYLVDKAIEVETTGIEVPEMDVVRFEDDYDINAVEQMCFTTPFFSSKRAVILRVTELKASEELKKLLQKVPQHVIFLVAADRVDKRSALYKVFQKNTMECSKPDPKKVYGLVKRAAEKEGITADYAAVEEMIRRLNYYEDPLVNLYAVIGCVKQLSLSGNITLPLVRAMLPESAAGKAWNLLRYVCEKKMSEAFSLLNFLLDSGESAIGVLSLMLRGFRLAWKEAAGVPVDANLRYQYAPAVQFPAKKLVLAQDTLETAVEQLKSGAEAGVMSRLAIAKLSDILLQ